MSSQPRFLKKNWIDLSNADGAITVTDAVATNTGSAIIDFVRNRNNYSAWLTTGSTDAANTTLDIDLGQSLDVDCLMLVKHNWKAFTIKERGSTSDPWSDFSTPIAQTTNADEVSFFSFDSVETRYLQIIITGCQVVDADKELYQLIIAEQLGQFAGWPMIKNPTHDRGRKATNMLSGKLSMVEGVGAFLVDLEFTHLKSAADLAIIEEIYTMREGCLLWLGGGDEAQFNYAALGYRKEDIYLVRPTNNYEPTLDKGIYPNGHRIVLKLRESID